MDALYEGISLQTFFENVLDWISSAIVISPGCVSPIVTSESGESVLNYQQRQTKVQIIEGLRFSICVQH